MEFWNDELRVCPKCKAKVSLREEPQTQCPACGATVRFYNYRPLPPIPPDPEETPPKRLLDSPTTTLLLCVTGVFGLVTLVAIHQRLVVAAVSVLSAIGFAVFGFLRDRDARRVEERLEKLESVAKSAAATRSRLQDAVGRYNALLATGDKRVEHYYDDLYVRAVREKDAAQSLRDAAARERAEAKAEAEKVRDEAARVRAEADRKCDAVEERIYAMAERLVGDHRKWTSAKMRPDAESYQRRKSDLEKAFSFVERVGYRLPQRIRKESLATLRDEFQRVMREHAMREEQKRINQRMREEEKIQRERERVVKEAEEREREIQARLEERERELQLLMDRSLREHQGVYDAEVEELKRQLAEAHANAERAKSMAQLTKAGHVYVLSNVGSFGEDVFKVGMTRRLEPDERVKELGDASVPFPFDVHAMISCENAPALENTLHRELTRYRVNRVNLRKEFFRVDLETILGVVRRNHGEVEYVAEPEALEYRDSIETTPDEVVELDKELAEIGVSSADFDE